MKRPLILLAFLGFPNHYLKTANTLISVQIAAMGRVCQAQGFSVAVAKTAPEEPKYLYPPTGLELWDGKTQPYAVWFHQAVPNMPGGIRPTHEDTLDVLERVLPNAEKIYRLVVDNNLPMSHWNFMKCIGNKSRNCGYVYKYKPTAPNPKYAALHRNLSAHVDRGMFWEVGYEPARSHISTGEGPVLPFKPAGVFSHQLQIAEEAFPVPSTKPYDFCYIGASRSNEQKKAARLKSMGEEFFTHPNSFYGGTLFKNRGFIRFPKACEVMGKAKAHLIVREKSMCHLPLQRYLQALAFGAIPIVLNEPGEVDFIHTPELQNLLRVKDYRSAVELVNNYDHLLPLLQEEKEYWMEFDKSRSEML